MMASINTSSATMNVTPSGNVLPVLLLEAITSCEDFSKLSMKIGENDWAWLVYGRSLFIWRHRALTRSVGGARVTKAGACYELQLPQSDLAHKADLVSVFFSSPSTQSRDSSKQSLPTQNPSAIAVSPEGTIRFWPNIAYEGNSIDKIATDLQGQECYLLTAIGNLGFILGTTTSTLVHVTINPSSQEGIECRTLRVPQGIFAGIGRKISSLFYPSFASQVLEERKLLQIVRDDKRKTKSDTLGEVVYLLAGTFLQKWHIESPSREYLIAEWDLERVLREGYLEKVWTRESTTAISQIQLWAIDIAVRTASPNYETGHCATEIVLLVGGLNMEVSNQLYYGLIRIRDESESTPRQSYPLAGQTGLSFSPMIVLRHHTVCYSPRDEEQILNQHLVCGHEDHDLVYIFDRYRILCIFLEHQDYDVLDFGRYDNIIIGAGASIDGNPLFFTQKDGLVRIEPVREPTVPVNASMIKFTKTCAETMDDDEAFDPTNKVAQLKKAILAFGAPDLQKCKTILDSNFPSTPIEDGRSDLDDAVAEFSREILDQIPRSDPRWAESSASGQTPNFQTASVIIQSQLNEKLGQHEGFVNFLKTTGLWNRLTVVNRPGTPLVSTKLLLLDDAEKIAAARYLRKLHVEYEALLDPVINEIVAKQGVEIAPRLTAQDIFYREVSNIGNFFIALLDYEIEQIDNGIITAREILELVTCISAIMVKICKEAAQFRNSQETIESIMNLISRTKTEWLAWLWTPKMRETFVKQYDLLVYHGLETAFVGSAAEDIELKNQIYANILDLADVILEGYRNQLKSLQIIEIATSERQVQLRQKFETDRARCIQPLVRHKQVERAVCLAEKYQDFDTLIQICDSSNNLERLRRYMIEFREEGFSDFLFSWYIGKGKSATLLSNPHIWGEDLNRFLSGHQSLDWMQRIASGDWQKTYTSLRNMAMNETRFLGRRKTLYSLTKLAAFAAGANHLQDLDTQLDLIQYQETLPVSVRDAHKFKGDVDMMPVLSPREVIELYISPKNVEADEYELKKALDIIYLLSSFSPRDICEAKDLRVRTYAAAALRDCWESMDTNNPVQAVQDTVFVKLALLDLTEDSGRNQGLPSLNDLMSCSLLQELSKSPTFEYLIKAAYEFIENA